MPRKWHFDWLRKPGKRRLLRISRIWQLENLILSKSMFTREVAHTREEKTSYLTNTRGRSAKMPSRAKREKRMIEGPSQKDTRGLNRLSILTKLQIHISLANQECKRWMAMKKKK